MSEDDIVAEVVERVMPGQVWQPNYDWVTAAIRQAARQGYRMGQAAAEGLRLGRLAGGATPPLPVGTPVWWLVDLMPTASARTTTRRGRVISDDGRTCAVASCGGELVEMVERSRLLLAEPKEGA